MKTRFGIFAAAAALASFALAACDSGGPVGAPSEVASSAPAVTPTESAPPETASPSPSPSPAVVDCSTEGIVPGRLGCLDTNLPVAGNPGEAMLTWEPDYCAVGDGRYRVTAAPDLVGIGGDGDGEIGRIDVYDPTITTATGIHVGSTAAEVAVAYPSNPAETAFSGTQLVVIAGDEGFVTIELADGWGADPWTVANIRIYAADQTANVPVYGTEDLAGACPMGY